MSRHWLQILKSEIQEKKFPFELKKIQKKPPLPKSLKQTDNMVKRLNISYFFPSRLILLYIDRDRSRIPGGLYILPPPQHIHTLQ